LLLIGWAIALAWCLWRFREAIHARLTRAGLVGVVCVYASLAVSSTILHRFVVYGRLSRPLLPFLCLIGGAVIAQWLARWPRVRLATAMLCWAWPRRPRSISVCRSDRNFHRIHRQDRTPVSEATRLHQCAPFVRWARAHGRSRRLSGSGVGASPAPVPAVSVRITAVRRARVPARVCRQRASPAALFGYPHARVRSVALIGIWRCSRGNGETGVTP